MYMLPLCLLVASAAPRAPTIAGAQQLLSRRTLVGGAAVAAAMPGLSVTAKGVTGIPSWTLAGNVAFPTLALNTAGLSADGSERAYREAIAAGITHVDFHPGIERDGVARVLPETDRSKLFLTTKIRKPPVGTPAADAAKLVHQQLEEDLSVLGVPFVDMLMLRDSPSYEVMQAQWAEVERAKASGLARSIGVVNYCEGSLGCILQTAKEAPAINYFMWHVGMGADAGGLRSYGESRGIRTFAYGALGEPAPSDELLTSAELRRIGKKHGGRSPEEVALRWVLQSGAACSVRPTTYFGLGASACDEGAACAAGLKARAQVFDWSLTTDEMATLTALTSPGGVPTLFSSTGCPNSFFAAK